MKKDIILFLLSLRKKKLMNELEPRKKNFQVAIDFHKDNITQLPSYSMQYFTKHYSKRGKESMSPSL